MVSLYGLLGGPERVRGPGRSDVVQAVLLAGLPPLRGSPGLRPLPVPTLVSRGVRYGVLPVPLSSLLLVPTRPSPASAPALTPPPPRRHHSGRLGGQRVVRLVGYVATLIILIADISGVVQDITVTTWTLEGEIISLLRTFLVPFGML